MKQYIVDAFTSVPFAGNPAAVCVMEQWPEETFMKNLALENNLSETAFIVKEEDGYRLRWFTPASEVDLCGHATLASSFVILNYIEPESTSVSFHTRNGILTIKKHENLYEMDFPVYEQKEINVTEEMTKAFGVKPLKAYLGTDLVCVFADEETVRTMNPDQTLLKVLPGRIQNVTARGKETDCVSRSFAPKLGVAEDPVCGSAHCQIAPYWSEILKKESVTAYQASARGGYLHCRIHENGRITISGEAVLTAMSEIMV